MGVLREINRRSIDAVSKNNFSNGSSNKIKQKEPRTSKITPKQHQELVRSFINEESSRGLVVFHGLGTGKTFTAIFAAETFLKNHKKAKVVVLVSASVKTQFMEQVKRIARKSKKYKFYSRQEFVRLDKNDSSKCSDNMIIVDEAHNVRNSEGKITKAIVACTDVAKKVLLLTATPLVNSVHEIGSMVRMLTPRSRIPLKYNSFTEEFGEDGLNKERRIKRLLKDKISFYVSEGSKSGFPREEFYEVFVNMEKRQCEIYDDVMKGKFSDKLEKVISDPTAMAKALVFFQKPRQFCNIVKEGREKYQPKIDALTSKVIKATRKGKKCVVYSQYIDSGLVPVSKALTRKNVKFGMLTGDTPKDDKQDIIDRYNSGKLEAILLSRTASEGVDLKETSEIHILEPHFHMSSLHQVKGRGIRYKSHKDPDAVVKVFVYFARKCDESSEKKGSHRTQSMDLLLWFMNKQKQETIDRFVDRVVVPSSIEKSTFSFEKERKELKTNVIEFGESSENEEPISHKKSKSKRKSEEDVEIWV